MTVPQEQQQEQQQKQQQQQQQQQQHGMDIEEFRRRGKETVDAICDYYATLEDRAVLSTVEPGYLAKLVPAEAPEEPESFDAIVADIHSKIMPGITHWQSPHFFNFYPSLGSFPGMLGDMYSSMFGVIGFNWACSPACTELETIALDWLAKLIGLDAAFLAVDPATGAAQQGGGVIQGTASEAIVVIMLAARQRVFDFHRKRLAAGGKTDDAIEAELGAVGAKLVAYGSQQTHSCGEKGALILNAKWRAVATDDQGRLRGDALAAAIAADVAAGLVPFCVVATVGTTATAAVDDLNGIADAVEAHNASGSHAPVYMHVDAAYAGSAMVCPEFRHLQAGHERFDSYCFNPHKWLMVNFDCSGLWVKDSGSLRAALSVTPSYLRNPASEAGLVKDYRDWQLPLGRRFRALKLWFVMRSYGASGLRKHIRLHTGLAAELGKAVAADGRFVVHAPVHFGLVTFRLKPELVAASAKLQAAGITSANAATKALVDRANTTGIFIGNAMVSPDTQIIRFSIGSRTVTKEHVDAAWAKIKAVADDLLA